MELGIKTFERVSQSGYQYTLLGYPTIVQEMIVNSMVGICEEEDDRYMLKNKKRKKCICRLDEGRGERDAAGIGKGTVDRRYSSEAQ